MIENKHKKKCTNIQTQSQMATKPIKGMVRKTYKEAVEQQDRPTNRHTANENNIHIKHQHKGQQSKQQNKKTHSPTAVRRCLTQFLKWTIFQLRVGKNHWRW